MKDSKDIKQATSLAELLDIKYGKSGTATREKFEEKTRLLIISETLKAARKEAHLTQQQLADKIGTKKSYISRIENGRSDIQLSTLFRIFENGLGKHVKLDIR
jgi:DNA-binding XRE family transcriptional regulator